jgi:hypothetical protein
MFGATADPDAPPPPDPVLEEFLLPAGLPGSGRRRYAAAMGLHLRGAISEEVLEVYRALALDDHADPAVELRRIALQRGTPRVLP